MPDEVLDYLVSNLRPGAKMLDVGCGTGIVTRQLKMRGLDVVGSDIDEEMVSTAHMHGDAIEYVVAPAEQLPFADDSFDAVTSFSAFHWFANERTVAEMRRVAPGGIAFIANREYGSFKSDLRDVLRKFMKSEPPNIKTDYDPKPVLERGGYADIIAKTFDASEQLTIDGAVAYAKSTSLWNLILEADAAAAELAISEHFTFRASAGIVRRETEIRTFLARE